MSEALGFWYSLYLITISSIRPFQVVTGGGVHATCNEEELRGAAVAITESLGTAQERDGKD